MDLLMAVPDISSHYVADAEVVTTLAGPDLLLAGDDFVLDQGLETAVLVSLFSDSRASAEEVANAKDRRGWWGEEPGERFGSRLWLLQRAKATSQALARALQYAQESLAWLVDEGILAKVSVVGEFQNDGRLALEVRLERGAARRWSGVWNAEITRQINSAGVTLRILKVG